MKCSALLLCADDLPGDPDGVCAVFAVLWRLGEADVSVFVDPALIDKEVLVDFHNSCKNKQTGRIRKQTHTHSHTHDQINFNKSC